VCDEKILGLQRKIYVLHMAILMAAVIRVVSLVFRVQDRPHSSGRILTIDSSIPIIGTSLRKSRLSVLAIRLTANRSTFSQPRIAKVDCIWF
jgi:hypothetical protein